ncbi:MAG: hypothetical protein M1150_01930 [Patescibacteria group bacterium]|nr:hypothetical protein [Patescibacteria group bacterium]
MIEKVNKFLAKSLSVILAFSGIFLGSNVISTTLSTVQGTSGYTLTNVVDKGQVKPNETLTYTAVVTNQTTDTTFNDVTLQFQTDGVNLVSGSGEYWFSDGVSCRVDNHCNFPDFNFPNFGYLNPGTSLNVVYKATVLPGMQSGEYVRITTSVKDHSSDNWTQTLTAESRVIIPDIKIGFFTFADRSSVKPNEELGYSIRVNNLSNVPLTNVYVQDYLPNLTSSTKDGKARVDYISGSTTVTRISDKGQRETISIVDNWITKPDGVNLGDLNPNWTFEIKFRVKIRGDVTNGEVLENVAWMKCPEEGLDRWKTTAVQVVAIVTPAPTPTPIPTPTPVPIPAPPPVVTQLPKAGPETPITLALMSIAPIGMALRRFLS